MIALGDCSIQTVYFEAGYETSVIYTPEELLED